MYAHFIPWLCEKWGWENWKWPPYAPSPSEIVWHPFKKTFLCWSLFRKSTVIGRLFLWMVLKPTAKPGIMLVLKLCFLLGACLSESTLVAVGGVPFSFPNYSLSLSCKFCIILPYHRQALFSWKKNTVSQTLQLFCYSVFVGNLPDETKSSRELVKSCFPSVCEFVTLILDVTSLVFLLCFSVSWLSPFLLSCT